MDGSVVPGILDGIVKRERLNQATCLQVFDVRFEEDQHLCTWSDGKTRIPGRLSSEIFPVVEQGKLEDGGVVRLSNYSCTYDNELKSHFLVASDLEVVSKAAPKEPSEPLGGAADNAQSLNRTQSVATPRQVKKENVGPYKTPASKLSGKFSGTPGLTPPSTGRKTLQPIQALNPYNNLWTIKARVLSKSTMRSTKSSGQGFSVFSITLVDTQGTEIEATFWREAAEQCFDKLQEGKVYFFTKGRVKPANRKYSSARNDYSIDFASDVHIEEAEDEDPDRMQAKLRFSKLDRLGDFLGKKMLTDIIAVVKEVRELGSVKRKADGVDLQRRDLVLVDSSGKMVKLTLWGPLAENEGAKIEALKDEHPVVSVSAVRVGEYEGVSLSSVTRSNVVINPAGKDAEELRSWWANKGCMANFAHAGEGFKTQSVVNPDERSWLVDIVKDKMELPSPEAKAEYFNLTACLMSIDPAQAPFFYEGDPATGRKVVEIDGVWKIKTAQQDPCSGMQWRYFVRASFMDCTGASEVILSNDQAERLFGRKGDEMHGLKESSPEEFEAIVREAQFSNWTLTVKSNSSEYNNELRQRLQVYGKFAPTNYVAESALLLSKIKA